MAPTSSFSSVPVRCLPAGRPRRDRSPRTLPQPPADYRILKPATSTRRALKIRTDPARVASLPFGSSVHGQHISGHCTRGRFNSGLAEPARDRGGLRSRGTTCGSPLRHVRALWESSHRSELRWEAVAERLTVTSAQRRRHRWLLHMLSREMSGI